MAVKAEHAGRGCPFRRAPAGCAGSLDSLSDTSGERPEEQAGAMRLGRACLHGHRRTSGQERVSRACAIDARLLRMSGAGPRGHEKGETNMNKAQVIGIATGVTVGLLGVALGVALARQEGREAARKWLAQSGDLAQKGQQRAMELGQQVRKTATEQAPKVQERLNTILSSTAPQAADALNAAIARTGLNGKAETTAQP